MPIKLTERQNRMLRWLWLGDVPRGTVDGYFWECDPTVRFDLRTARSLISRGLVWVGLELRGGYSLSSTFHLTPEGEKAAQQSEGG